MYLLNVGPSLPPPHPTINTIIVVCMVLGMPTLVPSGTNCSTNGLAKAIGSVLCTKVTQAMRSPGVGSVKLFLCPIASSSSMHSNTCMTVYVKDEYLSAK